MTAVGAYTLTHWTFARPVGCFLSTFTELSALVPIGTPVDAPTLNTLADDAHAVAGRVHTGRATALTDRPCPPTRLAEPHKAPHVGITSVAVVSHHLSVIRPIPVLRHRPKDRAGVAAIYPEGGPPLMDNGGNRLVHCVLDVLA